MRLSHNEGRLAEILRDFSHAWRRCGDEWHDQRREEFFREFIEPLMMASNDGISSLSQLTGILEQVGKRCK